MPWCGAIAQTSRNFPDTKPGEPALVVLDYQADPKWSAPDFESDLLTGLEGASGSMPRSRRVVHLDANIFRSVNVGWGFLAHVYPGGNRAMDQGRLRRSLDRAARGPAVHPARVAVKASGNRRLRTHGLPGLSGDELPGCNPNHCSIHFAATLKEARAPRPPPLFLQDCSLPLISSPLLPWRTCAPRCIGRQAGNAR